MTTTVRRITETTEVTELSSSDVIPLVRTGDDGTQEVMHVKAETMQMTYSNMSETEKEDLAERIGEATIDSALDTTSTRAVQNATIAAAINNLQSQIDQGGGGSGGGITVNESDGSITVLASGSVTVDESDGSITI